MLVTQLSSFSAIAISIQRTENYFSSTKVHIFLCFSGAFPDVFQYFEVIFLAKKNVFFFFFWLFVLFLFISDDFM